MSRSWVPYANLDGPDRRKSEALWEFAVGRPAGPIRGLMSATCKTGLAAARLRMVPHAVVAMAAIQYQGKLRFGAQWLCGGGSSDVVALSQPGARAMCGKCSALLESGASADPGVGYVYRCFDDANQLLYVGSTANSVQVRLARHERGAAWWQDVADVQVENFDSELAARAAEVRAIRTEHPIHNVRGRRRDAS